MATAGELLAKMIKKDQEGEDTSEIRKELIEQSKKQLGGYCTKISFENEGDKKYE